eukprot:Hpha_TRINITY_DN15287_c1_g16::TRINITY_DN15287_c1_g16_i1::g.68032::m.68032
MLPSDSDAHAAAVRIQALVRGRAERQRLPERLSRARDDRLRRAAEEDAVEDVRRQRPLLEQAGGDPLLAMEVGEDEQEYERALVEVGEDVTREFLVASAALHLEEFHGRFAPVSSECDERVLLASVAWVGSCAMAAHGLFDQYEQGLGDIATQEARRRVGTLRAAMPVVLLEEQLQRGACEEEESLAAGLISRREVVAKGDARARGFALEGAISDRVDDLEEEEGYGRYRVRAAEHAEGELLLIAQAEEMARTARLLLRRLPTEEAQAHADIVHTEDENARQLFARAGCGFLACIESARLPVATTRPVVGGAPGVRLTLEDERQARTACSIRELRERGEIYALFDRRLGQLALWVVEAREGRRRQAELDSEFAHRQVVATRRAEGAHRIVAAAHARQRETAAVRLLEVRWPLLERVGHAACLERAKTEKKEEEERRELQRSARLSRRVMRLPANCLPSIPVAPAKPRPPSSSSSSAPHTPARPLPPLASRRQSSNAAAGGVGRSALCSRPEGVVKKAAGVAPKRRSSPAIEREARQTGAADAPERAA